MKKLMLCLMICGMWASGARGIEISLKPLGTYSTGIFDDGAAQILDYHPVFKWLVITNAADEAIDVVKVHPAAKPELLFKIGLPGKPLSVAAHPRYGMVAVSVEAGDATEPGTVEFYRMTGQHLGSVQVGALPDMIVWTPDGRKLLVANEGEPNDDYTVDPPGSVSIITLGTGPALARVVADAAVETVGFDSVAVDPGVRIFGPGATATEDLEPEYIAVSEDSKTAWVTLQENNAIAKLDIDAATFSWVRSLGYKDHSILGNGLDASNKDDAIAITTWPVRGMYLPDAIAAFTIDGQQYLITANEGDSRDYDGFSEEERVKDLDLDPDAFAAWPDLADNGNLGRLKVTNTMGDLDDDGDYDELYCFGGRSFTIWTGDGVLVSDSGDQLEQIMAAKFPAYFNSTDDESAFDNRSDDKGPEPEHVTVADIGGSTVAFIGLERIGGIMVYDVSDPTGPRFLDYFNNRNFEADPETAQAGDLSTEGLLLIPADNSPTHTPLLVAANEISGSTTIFEVQVRLP
ncbi:MAG: choice-of-anchor I family protein [Phycisphaerales bacterium]|nr:MAG: choice-of-anchor I family protein [Phycisphaerales bacterium]